MGTSLHRALRAAGVEASLARARPRPADALLLCVPDRAVAEVARELAAHVRPGQVVAHTSGVLELDVLRPLADAGAHVGSLHPLFAVYRRRLPLEGAWAAVAGKPKARALLRTLASKAGMRPFSHPPSDRGLYHLAAVLAANSLAPLLAAGTELMRLAGVPPGEAQPAVLALMRSALAACEAQGPVEGLTGPVARGDASTVADHLRTMQARAPGMAELYVALNMRAVELAERRKPAPPNLDAIVRLLRGRRGGS